jgi:alpha-amylase/alpha-mannosidase (GH57 family)
MLDNKLKVVLYWHMHQPEYRDVLTGVYQQPWTYLHTIKDYVDMAMHLEAQPQARVVINFTPILLEQIEDYATQVINYLTNNIPIRDPLLSALVNKTIPADHSKRIEIIDWCSRSHEKHMIQRFPEYNRLIKVSSLLKDNSQAIAYLNDQYFFDLLVWYHLGWLAEHVRRDDLRIKRLLKKQNSFDNHDRIELITVIGELLDSTIPRYRALAESKQIELSTTPYAHPIIPLLIDLNSALEATPDVPMPTHTKYPGGEERARWQIERGIEVFKQHFGFAPAGCWPSEGAISAPTCKLIQEFGFKWLASGDGVFRNSVNHDISEEHSSQDYFEHLPNQLHDQNIICFFRDDRLSDLIGFEYSNWHADDAVANLIHNLKEIAKEDSRHPNTIVSIILDGENAWEHYPKNGYYFLNTLYEELSQHPEIELTTYSDYLEDNNNEIQVLPKLVTGSWVYGTLSTWIGNDDKNRGWDMLCDAKQCYDEVDNSVILSSDTLKKAAHQLAICEGSDWFWWFGDYNSSETVSDFEILYRKNLSNLYEILGKTPPQYLSSSFTYGKGSPEGGGSMRKSG